MVDDENKPRLEMEEDDIHEHHTEEEELEEVGENFDLDVEQLSRGQIPTETLRPGQHHHVQGRNRRSASSYFDCISSAVPWDRHIKRKILIEIPPPKLRFWAVLAIFLLYLVLVGVSIIIGVFAGPNVRATPVQNVMTTQIRERMYGNVTFNGSVKDVSVLNQEVVATLVLQNAHYGEACSTTECSTKSQSIGFGKSDIKFTVKIYTLDSNGNEIVLNKHSEFVHQRELTCPQNSKYCSPMIIMYETNIHHSNYNLEVKMLNLQQLYDDDMLGDYADIQFAYYEPAFTLFELIWRITLLGLMAPFTIAFLIYMVLLMDVSQWQTEQKWVAVLLVLTIIYDNPLYIFQVYFPSWILPFLNIVFITTFICYLMSTILVISHSIIAPPKERNFWFFFPKLVLGGILWLFLIILLSFVRLRNRDDSAYTYLDELSGIYSYLVIFMVIIIVVYLFILAYYFLRAIGRYRRGHLHINYSTRLYLLFSFTLFMVVMTITEVLIFLFRASWNNSAQFLVFFVLYNLYALILGVCYIPIPKTKPDDEAVQEEDHADKEDTFYARME